MATHTPAQRIALNGFLDDYSYFESYETILEKIRSKVETDDLVISQAYIFWERDDLARAIDDFVQSIDREFPESAKTLTEEELLKTVFNNINAWVNEEEVLNDTTDGANRFDEAIAWMRDQLPEMSFIRDPERERDINHKIAMQFYNDALEGSIFPEMKMALKQIRPLYKTAPQLLEACKGILGSFHDNVKTESSLKEFPALLAVKQALDAAETPDNE